MSIGPYRVLSVLGEGGFGVVYLAERREPFVQRVALKVIKPGMDSKAVLARFEQERQALAVMDHPNVAKVLDGGVTGSGQPYFVMEYVKGEPITHFCDRMRLTVRERLRLFAPVCEAVQHAHMKGIIHRDIKPSNILVSLLESGSGSGARADGGRERESGAGGAVDGALVKVIDFGVAKAISQTLTERTIFTESGQVIGTPEYMSPEQAEMGSLDIDTRTDVYSLGVVLYELLTGVLPFESVELRKAGFEGARRIIQDREPPTPSRRLTGVEDQAAATIAAKRQAGREGLARELRRELEWIPLKAMRKDRTRRYATALDLAGDIRKYLEGLPLSAGPESAGYRVRKFVRRNRGAVAAGVGLAAVLVMGGGVAAWGMAQARVAEERTEIEKERAERAERERRTARSGALLEQIESAAAMRNGGEVLRVADLALGEGHPQEVLIRLRRIEALDSTGDAQRAMEEAGALAAHPDLGEHRAMVLLWHGDLLLTMPNGDIKRAEALLREALAAGLPPAAAEFARGLLAEDWDLARAHFEKAVEAEAFHLRANQMLALSLLVTGRLKEADSRARLVGELVPGSVDGAFLRIVALSLDGRSAEAEGLVDEIAAKLGGQRAELLRRLARLIERSSQQLVGMLTFSQMEVAEQFRVFQIINEFQEVIGGLDKAPGPEVFGVRAPPLKVPLDVLKTKVYQVLMSKDPAILDQVLTPVGSGAEGLREMATGTLLFMDGKFEEAHAHLERAVTSPSLINIKANAYPLLLLCQTYLSITGPEGRREQLREDARRSLGEVIARYRADRLASEPMVRAAMRLGQDDAARLLAERAEQTYPGESHWTLVRARVEYETGNYWRAFELAGGVLAKEPKNAQAAGFRDKARERLGMIGRGDEAYTPEEYLARKGQAPAPASPAGGGAGEGTGERPADKGGG